ncbi:rhodanese domain-containing protein CG4456-like [Metopolophium dirhodum]|uniref:rhodanese domain-containing protein CG4456-like n=1 Tax=Metopolophium dirhodum TaxID=44670 RepID=UPI00298F5F8E|nr:rhodanese domain-containing protein CG4456-like [Metopolophium dirhodum]XP_060873746.1 rhodanese domain-containing protein CG4456-like [Metopolophium dirhodum]
MLNILRSRFSPFMVQMHYFSSGTVVNKQLTKTTKPMILYNTKSNLCSLIQNRSFAGTSPPLITDINYERFKKFINQNEVLIIDVRTKEELAATGVLPNSYNIPLDELSTAFESTPDKFLEMYNIPKPDKDQKIVFSCAKGIRSLKACRYVADLGYKNLFNYTEGWFGWESHK